MNLDLAGLKVMLAVPVNRDLPWQTHIAIVRTICALKDRGIAFDHQLLVGGSIVELARSELAGTFLSSDMNRLFWIDSDMSWTEEAFLRILALSTKMEVVGAAYPAKKDPHLEFMVNLDAGANDLEANEFGCIPLKGFGLGFTCVQRVVIERLAEQAPKIKNKQGRTVPIVFRCGVEGERFVGEDMNFFLDCEKLGYTINCDPTIVLGHVGAKEYRGKLLDALTPQAA